MEGDIDITGILSGDAEEFRTLFYRWYPKIRGFINCLVKSDAVSEDLTQDIFLRIWKDRDMLGNIASIESYMYRMARNMSLNWLKHRKVETGYAPVWESPYDDAPDSIVAEKEMRLLVDLVVSGMPEQRRRIFEMSRYFNIRNSEIAEKLNISKKTVENHLNLALREIRESPSRTISSVPEWGRSLRNMRCSPILSN